MADGKQLEELVAYVERELLPEGFEVICNRKIYRPDGIQIAEFDIEIRGKVGLETISWLIECRDRPGDGPQSGAWIEQLFGRRARFKFNRVTAVSTTGFAAGAVDFAKEADIELREVNAVTGDTFKWISADGDFSFTRRVSYLKSSSIIIDEAVDEERRSALLQIFSRAADEPAFLRSNVTGQSYSPHDAFSMGLTTTDLFDRVEDDGSRQKAVLIVQCTDEDHYTIDTELGQIRVQAIRFEGEIWIERTKVPIALSKRYERSDDGSVISEIVSFAPMEMPQGRLFIELHRIEEDGVTRVLLKRASEKTA